MEKISINDLQKEGLNIIYNSMSEELKTKYMEHILNMAYLQGQLDYIQEQIKKGVKEDGNQLLLEQANQ